MKSFRFWINTERGKNIFIGATSIFVTTIILLAIFIPLLFIYSSKDSSVTTIGYNRDPISGTREAFENSIDFDEENQSFTENVLTVSGNSDMVKKVMQNDNSIGYASFNTVLEINDEGMYEEIDGINILDFNGVDPLESSGLNSSVSNPLSDYKAKRYFNVFFRVDEKYNNLIYDNLYINKDTTGNLWTSGGSFIDTDNEYEQLKSDYKVTNTNAEQVLLYSFAYFNWLLFSASANEEITIIYDQGYDYANFEASYNQFLQNIYDNSSTNDLITNTSNPVEIITVGSTSVTPTVDLTTRKFATETMQMLETFGSNLQIIFQSNAVGSGDAFNPDPPSVTSHSWVAFQSRSSNDSEESKFNQTFEENIDGAFDIVDNKVYSSFEIDALTFIVSDELTIKINEDETSKELIPTNIEDIGVNLIYTHALSFEDIYGLGLVDGVINE